MRIRGLVKSQLPHQEPALDFFRQSDAVLDQLSMRGVEPDHEVAVAFIGLDHDLIKLLFQTSVQRLLLQFFILVVKNAEDVLVATLCSNLFYGQILQGFFCFSLDVF